MFEIANFLKILFISHSHIDQVNHLFLFLLHYQNIYRSWYISLKTPKKSLEILYLSIITSYIFYYF